MSYTVETVFQYTPEQLDDFLSNFGAKYDDLKTKRYMTIYYLMTNNLLKADRYSRDPNLRKFILESNSWSDFLNFYNFYTYKTEKWETFLEKNMYNQIVEKYPENVEDIFIDWVVLAEKVSPSDVEYWINKGIDLNKDYPTMNGSTPLEIACSRGEKGMIEGFIKFGAIPTDSCNY